MVNFHDKGSGLYGDLQVTGNRDLGRCGNVGDTGGFINGTGCRLDAGDDNSLLNMQSSEHVPRRAISILCDFFGHTSSKLCPSMRELVAI